MPPKRKLNSGKKPVPPKPVEPHDPVNRNPVSDSASSSSVSAPMDEQFKQEIVWCLERLEKSMQYKDMDQRQGADMMKAWKSLSSVKTPIVKKRQIMRTMFGDYRAAMEKEAKQYSIKPSSMQISQVSSASKSKYFKPSASAFINGVNDAAKSFEFGFQITDEDNRTENTDPSSEQSGDNFTKPENGHGSMIEPSVNYYPMQTKQTDSSFTFNFDVGQTDDR